MVCLGRRTGEESCRPKMRLGGAIEGSHRPWGALRRSFATLATGGLSTLVLTPPPLWKNRTLAWHIRGLTLASVRPLRPVLEDLGVRGSLGPSPALAHHRGFSHRGSQRLVGDALKSKGRMVDQGDRPIKRCVPGVHSASIDFVSATRRSRSSKSAIFGSFCGLKGRKVRKKALTSSEEMLF